MAKFVGQVWFVSQHIDIDIYFSLQATLYFLYSNHNIKSLTLGQRGTMMDDWVLWYSLDHWSEYQYPISYNGIKYYLKGRGAGWKDLTFCTVKLIILKKLCMYTIENKY